MSVVAQHIDLNVCYNMTMSNWCNSIGGEVKK